MTLLSIYDTLVSQELANWLGQSAELFVHVHDPHSGSSGSDYLLPSMSIFNELTTNARPGFFVLRERQFPMRGTVDNDFVEAALQSVKDGEWYKIVQREFYPLQLRYYGSGDTHNDLRRDLEECRGMNVCVGPEPVFPNEYLNWDLNVDDKIIIAVKP